MLNRHIEEIEHINKNYKFFKTSDLRKLDRMVMDGEISLSRQIELINEMAYDFYNHLVRKCDILEGIINKKNKEIAAKNLTLSAMELKVNKTVEKMKCNGVHCKGTGIAEYCEYCMDVASESNPNS